MTPTPSPAFLRGPVSTLQEMLRTIWTVPFPLYAPRASLTKTP